VAGGGPKRALKVSGGVLANGSTSTSTVVESEDRDLRNERYREVVGVVLDSDGHRHSRVGNCP
jgi:hypothetical protein